LKPDGALVDIHPVSEPSAIEIHHAGKVDLVGHLSVREWCIDFEQADIALAKVLQRGLLIQEREALFDMPTYYTSATELGDAQKESVRVYARDAQAAVEPLPQIERLTARAEELMQAAGGDARLVLHERTHVSRLRRA